jgi:adenosine deaminase
LDLLGVERVDHGVRSVQDPALVRRLATEEIPLTVCPLSNVRLQVVASLADHMLPHLLAAGVVTTINSDDPAYFGGYADDNYAAVADQFSLTATDLAGLAHQSVRASFLPPDRKAALDEEIDAWLRAQPSSPRG